MRVVTVLQTRALHALHPGSSEFTAGHVQALHKQVKKYSPCVDFQCLTDLPKIDGIDTRKLRHGWPGWWAKMELFDPELKGDFLFMDLDTVIHGSLDSFESLSKLTLLRDFYRDGKKLKEGLGSGLMFLPERDRRAIWDEFMVNPRLTIRLNPRGDQHFLEQFWLNKAERFQDVVPGQVVSWKVNCKNGIVPPDARVVCFHGKPRPWEVGQFSGLYR